MANGCEISAFRRRVSRAFLPDYSVFGSNYWTGIDNVTASPHMQIDGTNYPKNQSEIYKVLNEVMEDGHLMFDPNYMTFNEMNTTCIGIDKKFESASDSRWGYPCVGVSSDFYSTTGTLYSKGVSWTTTSAIPQTPSLPYRSPNARSGGVIFYGTADLVTNVQSDLVGRSEYYRCTMDLFFPSKNRGYVVVRALDDFGITDHNGTGYFNKGLYLKVYACYYISNTQKWDFYEMDNPPNSFNYEGQEDYYFNCGSGLRQEPFEISLNACAFSLPSRQQTTYVGLSLSASLPNPYYREDYLTPMYNFVNGVLVILSDATVSDGETDSGDPPPVNSNPFDDPIGQEDTGTGPRDNGSDVIGVNGDGDSDPGTLPPASDSPLSSNGGFLTAYKLTPAEMGTLGQALWSSSVMQDIQNSLYKPLENIIACYYTNAPVPSEIVTSTTVRIAGYQFPGATADRLNTNWMNLDCGNVNISEYFGSCLDYSPYTTISLYLPYIGIVPLDCDYIVDSNLNVRYNIDLMTGDCVAHVSSKKTHRMEYEGIVGSYNGNLYAQIPMTTSNTWASRNLLGVGSLITGLASKNPLGGTLNALNTMATKPQYQKSGALTSNTGMMGYKFPYLIIERPVDYIPQNYYKYQGLNSYVYKKLSDCSGLVICQNPILDIQSKVDTPAPLEEEIEEIKMWLEKGVRL